MLDDDYTNGGDPEWPRYNWYPPQPTETPPVVTPPTTVAPPTTTTNGPGGKTPQQIEAEGREYDRQNGLLGGYMMNGVWVNGSPSSTRPGGDLAPGGDDTGLLMQLYGKTPPAWQSGPGFAPPTFQAPPPFSYKEFQAPTMDSIYADPSYQFRKGEGEKALSQRIASTGAYRTGGTIKDFINYNQNAASQEYGNIFSRATDTHNMGLQQALGTYGTNYGVSRDVYDRLYQGNKATFDAQTRDNELMNQRNFNNFIADYDIFDRDRKRIGGFLFDAVGLEP